MKIYSMTATFGKLEHETLNLRPGLNIIHAPNEWGKSTWCAFLMAMLYGIDTRERTTQDTLAIKERYAPWSGSPMSGSMDICWNGRDITIERSTKGRSIFGVFRAFETNTGVEVPELTATNCGQMLLGVEKSVFTRAGFLKLTDLPVTEDQALWRRLNALVTTGDESGASDALAQKLKDLKNQCRSNRANGLIPQVLAQKAALEEKLSRLYTMQDQHERLLLRQQQLEEHGRLLANHRDALAYRAAQENAGRIRAAEEAQAQAREQLSRLQQQCAAYPERQILERQQHTLKELQQEEAVLQMEQQMLHRPPQEPDADPLFADMTPEQAAKATEADRHAYLYAKKDPRPLGLMLIALVCIAACAIGFILTKESWAFWCLLPGVLGLVLAAIRHRNNKVLIGRLLSRYGSADPDDWTARAVAYAQSCSRYAQAQLSWEDAQSRFLQQQASIRQRLQQHTGGSDLHETRERIRQALQDLDALDAAQREVIRADSHTAALQALSKPVAPPQFPDDLNYTKEETDRLLADCGSEQRQIIKQIGQFQGQMTTLGQEEELQQQLGAVNARLQKLQDTYDALELALKTLTEASAQLRRRFAPRISQRAQAIFSRLTGSRYDRLTLGSDMSLQVSAENEDTLRGSLWRSDGTVDQLYLALRLAVAEELTPNAPLVLDDALVRFDDTRLAAAMEVLKETAENKQVLLFTCQTREAQMLEN